MKTAVEWLSEKIQEQINIFCQGGILDDNMIDKAKAIEKEQIEEAFNLGYDQWTMKTSEQYYKETYEQE